MNTRLDETRKPARRLISAATMLALTAVAATAAARSEFAAKAEFTLAIDTPVITNKFGYASSFPKPINADNPFAANPLTTNPSGRYTDEIEIGGGVANGAFKGRRSAPRSFRLEAEGTTVAEVPGAVAAGEAFATGRTRVRLGNFTGRDGLPAPEAIDVDLAVLVDPFLRAEAENDANSRDRAAAKFLYRLVDGDSGEAVIPSLRKEIKEAEGLPKEPDYIPGLLEGKTSIRLAPNSFVTIDLIGHVFANGASQGKAAPGNPPPALHPVFPAQDLRFGADFPDEAEMLVNANPHGLFGDATNQGGWRLAHAGGANGGEDAINGLPTVQLAQVMLDPSAPNFIDLAIEAPIGEGTMVALQQDLMVPGGAFAFGLQQELVLPQQGEPLPPDPALLSFLGPQSQLPPQSQGPLQPVGFDDPLVPTQVFFEGELGYGQPTQLVSFLQVHDLVDGVEDGMARFTLMQFSEGIFGDYNGDFANDENDLALWRELYNSDDIRADGNGDGIVNAADYTTARDAMSQFGFDGPVAVPEPTAAGLFFAMIAIAGAATRR